MRSRWRADRWRRGPCRRPGPGQAHLRRQATGRAHAGKTPRRPPHSRLSAAQRMSAGCGFRIDGGHQRCRPRPRNRCGCRLWRRTRPGRKRVEQQQHDDLWPHVRRQRQFAPLGPLRHPPRHPDDRRRRGRHHGRRADPPASALYGFERGGDRRRRRRRHRPRGHRRRRLRRRRVLRRRLLRRRRFGQQRRDHLVDV